MSYKIAFFSAKEYDIQSFSNSQLFSEFEIKFFETGLTEDTVNLAGWFFFGGVGNSISSIGL